MITCTNDNINYRSVLTNGQLTLAADATPDKGGQGDGFRPHELLEAALASCMNIYIQMAARNHKMPLEQVTTQVSLNREHEGEAIFEYQIQLIGNLTDEQHMKLCQIAGHCPVHQTLKRAISVRYVYGNED
jgi:putative redox protein